MSLENILYVVVGIVWLIVSINKQRKAKLAQQMNPTPVEETNPSNNDDFMQAFESIFSTPPAEPIPAPVVTEIPPKKSPRPSKTTKQPESIDGVHKNYQFGVQEATPSFFATNRIDEPEVLENNPIIEEFDARKAFIYSEILRRPYAN